MNFPVESQQSKAGCSFHFCALRGGKNTSVPGIPDRSYFLTLAGTLSGHSQMIIQMAREAAPVITIHQTLTSCPNEKNAAAPPTRMAILVNS